MSSALFDLQVIDQGPQGLVVYHHHKPFIPVDVCSLFSLLLATHHNSVLSDYFNELNVLGRMEDIYRAPSSPFRHNFIQTSPTPRERLYLHFRDKEMVLWVAWLCSKSHG